MGWRYLIFTVGGITLGCFILRFGIFRFRESPKFLLYRGRDAEAAKIIQQIAAFNKRDCQITEATFDKLTEEHNAMTRAGDAAVLGAGKVQRETSWSKKLQLELYRYKILFSTVTLARITTLVWLTYFCD